MLDPMKRRLIFLLTVGFWATAAMPVLWAEEQVDLLELMQALQVPTNLRQQAGQLTKSAKSWDRLSETDQAEVVRAMIELFKIRDNAAILLPASYYATKINEQLAADPTMLELPLPIVLKVLAVMDYDFYNGQNKEELAKQVLGEDVYEQNKKRRALLGYLS
ncbi:MAG: hypothetical protein COV74_03255 [Candidatus Omnitrophica bacterium CG11_big_fil_rev_8_21_14_0_20_45_26]|uniref:Uncharacterized protein n=1 Tax=Candidatus Abzuiibacterium crystallinum TaxID=1974748 RepID=A0A2H0LR22_9BACT|nr:MAG: hypothetical protein COV74_03255 [Candidatus Omnitrophica bacterium CG11_big_fil_rev_8_21_14_0_20_45_26]PIW64692.1 MAG: hypothetical protein COW12_05280 [Candidatus Omnitrophica bacterium CG12_big_fil_rev_8_21_14_0_65_45_16]